ncbi:hypothetical protein KOY48_03865 [Candidatus Minimicrobia naudis]|uniref:Protein CR006 P-loop domain-containing protein n=1 Tax=Candidatus Minimicrobia naudis TaxID=2841263 RepID=A0A8F1MAY6_9BACT|nr:hypothetical protein KOY48_03865 [Candidatus Minimicrobia naudis]
MESEFTFSDTSVIAIYAKNGLMKTSLAKTFKKIQDEKRDEIRDEIFDIQGEVKITIDGQGITNKDVFVIKSFEASYQSTNLADLLVDESIKEKIAEVLKLKSDLLKDLEKASGLKIKRVQQGKNIRELESEIIEDFNLDGSSILLGLELIQGRIDIDCSEIKYSDIFDNTTLGYIKKKGFQENIKEFCKTSNEIYERHGFLKKGIFSLSELKNVEKSLKDNGFFVNDNLVKLFGEEEIHTAEDFSGVVKRIEQEIKQSKAFTDIEKDLKTAKGGVLRRVIENNPDIVQHLKESKLKDLRRQLWLSYIKDSTTFSNLKDKWNSLRHEIGGIDPENTRWGEALRIFEERFTVPYKMQIANGASAVMGEDVPQVEFVFTRNGRQQTVSRGELESKDTLSQGEKRSLYLLNIIFDIEKMKKDLAGTDKEVLLIVDDIADSFDYKNKYAIVEYLYEMANCKNFKLIILSHNFDFYRTVTSRFGLPRCARLHAELDNGEVILREEYYQNNPIDHWKDNMTLTHVVALIPAVRNLIEYTKGKDNEDYSELTKLLHSKRETSGITFQSLKDIYERNLGRSDFININIDTPIVEAIYEGAERITIENSLLEYKIILAIAIRHKAEEYMKRKLEEYSGQISWGRRGSENGSSQEFLNQLEAQKNQTRSLSDAFKQTACDNDTVKVIDLVIILIPEYMHLNYFSVLSFC